MCGCDLEDKALSDKEYNWFVKADLSKYKGEYVIIRGKKVVLHGRKLTKLLSEFRRKYPTDVPKIARIPEEETLVL